MKCKIIGLLAETSLHFGAGHNEGYIDLPLARESATGYPVLVGSSLKGSLRDRVEREWDGRVGGQRQADVERIFGKADGAGGIIVSDARLLLLPVRSLQTSYKWLICPLIIERLNRDLERAGLCRTLTVPSVTNGTYLGADQGPIFLEEREFTRQNGLPACLIPGISGLMGDPDTRGRLDAQLTVVSNDDFHWFAGYATQVTARNVLNDNKTSSNLWYEETLPPDTLMYAILAERHKTALSQTLSVFEERPYLQAGGNETVGQGWLRLKVADNGAPETNNEENY